MSFNFNDSKLPEDFKSAVAENMKQLNSEFGSDGWSFVKTNYAAPLNYNHTPGWFIEELESGGQLYGYSTVTEAQMAATQANYRDQLNGHADHNFMLMGFVSKSGEIFELNF